MLLIVILQTIALKYFDTFIHVYLDVYSLYNYDLTSYSLIELLVQLSCAYCVCILKMAPFKRISDVWKTVKSPPKYLVASCIVAIGGFLNG